MEYNIFNNNELINTIVANESFVFAYCEEMGYTYSLAERPKRELSPAEQREEAYNTEAIIEWDDKVLTVTEAAQLWQYYAAEGSEKANELTVLIAEAKTSIREKYPD